jgi:hypothetical protein
MRAGFFATGVENLIQIFAESLDALHPGERA